MAIKVLLRARGEGGVWREDDTTEEIAILPQADEDAPPIIRKPGREKPPSGAVEESQRRPRKKKPGAETWDF